MGGLVVGAGGIGPNSSLDWPTPTMSLPGGVLWIWGYSESWGWAKGGRELPEDGGNTGSSGVCKSNVFGQILFTTKSIYLPTTPFFSMGVQESFAYTSYSHHNLIYTWNSLSCLLNSLHFSCDLKNLLILILWHHSDTSFDNFSFICSLWTFVFAKNQSLNAYFQCIFS